MFPPQPDSLQSRYALTILRRAGALLLALALLAIGAIADILTGPAMLPLHDVMKALFGFGETTSRVVTVIVHDIRVPMTLMAILVGASLSVAGNLMQTILRNPLASPYTLGFSAAAGFGAAAIIITGFRIPGLEAVTIPLAATGGGVLAALIVYSVARKRALSPEVMVLAGIAVLFLFQSLQSLIQYMASPEVLQEIVFWLFGNLTRATYKTVTMTGVTLLLCLVFLTRDVWKLTALKLGDERASSLGVAVEPLRLRCFVVVVILTAAAVAFVGTIGFIGLVAPHIARMIVGEEQRFLLPFSALMGALIMTLASLASKLIIPGTIVPIGIVTSIVGVPFLFALIIRDNRRFW